MSSHPPGVLERLADGAARLGVALSAVDARRLMVLLDELEHWNHRYNLTSIRPSNMVTHHLLDSLAVLPELRGPHVADAGTGAGFPGLPLAICSPQRHFTLIDSTAKKVRFVSHAIEKLELTNVTAVHARIEALRIDAPFDSVLARAFGPIPRLLAQVAPLCGPATEVLAMKGKWPQEELAALVPPWRVVRARELHVPGLDAARCVIVLAGSAAAAPAPTGV